MPVLSVKEKKVPWSSFPLERGPLHVDDEETEGSSDEESEDSGQPERKKLKTTETQSSSAESARAPLSPPSPAYHPLKPQFLPRQISRAKPNYTYTDLISLALRDRTSLTVSEIYQWIRSGSVQTPGRGN